MYEAGPAGLVETKLHPPVVHGGTVPRDELLARLDRPAGVRLTLVAAPAGSGKTTSLGLWCARRAGRGPVAWVSLDEHDDDPVVLWLHVLEAVRRACPDADVPPLPTQVAPGAMAEVVLPRLVNALAAAQPVALVLDDFHRLSAGEARDSLSWLVANAPASLEVVVASRTEPALGLGRLRARGQLHEIRAEDLRFTRDEAVTLLNDRLGLELAATDVDDLVKRTEGWPAGIYLAALSLRGVDDPSAFLARFDGHHRYVVDFLVTDVLQAHPPELQDLMLRTSVLERLSGSLCDAVLDRVGSGALLAELARSNLFLTALDDRGEWYRFHHLFGQLLRVELEHRTPGLAAVLHHRAYQWFRAHGHPEPAMDHALAAGAYDAAAELLCTTARRFNNEGKVSTVLGWLGRLPCELVDADSQLLLVEAWAAVLAGDFDRSTAAVDQVYRLGRLSDGPLLDGFSSVEASVVTLRAMYPAGDSGARLRDALRAAELEGPESPYRSTVACAIGWGSYYLGKLDEGERWFAVAEELSSQTALRLVRLSALAGGSLVAGVRGDLDRQQALAETAVDSAREHSLEDYAGDAFVANGEALRARGELAAALPFLDRGVAGQRTRFGSPVDLAHALLLQASVLRALGERSAARAAVAEAGSIIASCPDPGALLVGRLAEAEQPIPRPRRVDTELSARELAVLRMLMGSLSEREIARELYLSHNTVHTHARSIYRKLGATSRPQAVQKARELGLFRGQRRPTPTSDDVDLTVVSVEEARSARSRSSSRD